jgi:proline iminopeptidase
LCAAYAQLLADPDAGVREEAARRWCEWEDTHVSLMPGWKPHPRYDDPEFRMTFARLVTHYWSHNCFLTKDQIWHDMERIAAIPSILVHGRHDISGPMATAWRLHSQWPASRLVVVDEAGHGGSGFTEAVVAAINDIVEVR